MESAHKSNKNSKLGGLGYKDQVVLLKVEGRASAFKKGYLDLGGECFAEANIDN